MSNNLYGVVVGAIRRADDGRGVQLFISLFTLWANTDKEVREFCRHKLFTGFPNKEGYLAHVSAQALCNPNYINTVLSSSEREHPYSLWFMGIGGAKAQIRGVTAPLAVVSSPVVNLTCFFHLTNLQATSVDEVLNNRLHSQYPAADYLVRQKGYIEAKLEMVKGSAK